MNIKNVTENIRNVLLNVGNFPCKNQEHSINHLPDYPEFSRIRTLQLIIIPRKLGRSRISQYDLFYHGFTRLGGNERKYSPLIGSLPRFGFAVLLVGLFYTSASGLVMYQDG